MGDRSHVVARTLATQALLGSRPRAGQSSACWSVVRVLVMVGGAIALALIALSFVVAPTLDDPSHPRYHAVSVIVLLGVAWLAVVRGPATIARRSVAAASVLLAVAFIFEAVGCSRSSRPWRRA